MRTVLVNTIDSIVKRKEEISDCKEMLRRCGANTGNACFVDAMYQQLNFGKEVKCFEINPEENESLFVLPASNWINVDGKVLQRTFLHLANTNVKLLVLGLGIQMGLNQSVTEFVEQLSEETVTALKIMSEHSISIGVRGELTGEVLDRLSIHNWEVIGCPSFYEPYRMYKTVKLRKPSCEKVLFNTNPGLENEHRVLEMAMSMGASICLQSMMDLPLTLTEGLSIEQRLLDSRYPGANMTTWELENYIKEQGHIFYNRQEWSEYLVNNDISFSVGARFHGNMMAFTNGIPALWLVHDGRTKELVDAMKLPHILHSDLIHFNKVEELMDICSYDESFTQNYIKMGQTYVEFLNKNGVCHTFEE